MGFSETKNTIIQSLIAKKKSKDKLLAIATTEKTAKTNVLTAKTIVSDNDKLDLQNADNNLNAANLAKESIVHLLNDVDLSLANSDELHKKVLTVVEDAHQTARRTATFAMAVEELNVLVIKDVKHNKVILNLLVKDSAKAVLDAKTAVTFASKALVDAIQAATSVIHLHNALSSTKNILDGTLPIFETKTGIDALLLDLKTKSEKMYEQSLKDKSAAESALREATKKFNDASIEYTTAAKALDAANAAVGQIN